MTKTGLIAAIANEMEGTTKTHVRGFLTALNTVVAKCLRKDKKFVLPSIVKLTVVGVPPKAERKARNPLNGKEMIVAAKPASKKLKARFLKAIKVEAGIVPPPPPSPAAAAKAAAAAAAAAEKKESASKAKKTAKK
jgi:nucleoid DNA-binding protein